jgi:hypothetical protein
LFICIIECLLKRKLSEQSLVVGSISLFWCRRILTLISSSAFLVSSSMISSSSYLLKEFGLERLLQQQTKANQLKEKTSEEGMITYSNGSYFAFVSEV